MSIKIIVEIKIENSKFDTKSSGMYQHICESEEEVTLDELALAICYAIPQHEFFMFDVMELYREGKSIGHAEV